MLKEKRLLIQNTEKQPGIDKIKGKLYFQAKAMKNIKVTLKEKTNPLKITVTSFKIAIINCNQLKNKTSLKPICQ